MSAEAQGRTLIELGRYDEAVTVLRAAAAESPEDAHVRCRLAHALVGAERWDEAIETAREAIALAPDEEWGHRLLAVAYRGAGWKSKAVQAAREAVRLEPEIASTHMVLADCLLTNGDTRAALPVAERALALDPSDAGIRQTLGDIALAQDRSQVAERHYRDALRLDAEDALAHNNLGVALQQQRRTEEASEAFERAARLDPRFDVPRENLGAHGRRFVNGPGLFVGLWLLYVGIRGAINGSPGLLVAVGLILAALAPSYLKRRGERLATLSPATRRVLDEQRWWQRAEVRTWRPIFWLIPSPVWFVIGVGGLALTGFVFATDPPDPFGGAQILLVAGLLAFCAITGHYAHRYGRRRGWWSW